MLSKKEREYIEKPKEFEKKHSDSYIRKIRNHIRKKVIFAVDDLINIFELDLIDSEYIKNDKDRDHRYCKSKLGRKRKPLIDCFTYLSLDSFWGLSNNNHDKNLKYLKENMELAKRKWFSDTKFGKYLQKSKSK